MILQIIMEIGIKFGWNTGNEYYDLMINDEYVFLSNAIPVQDGGPFIVSRLSAGKDQNNKPMIIKLVMLICAWSERKTNVFR